MLTTNLSSKVIAILGCHTLPAKVIIKALLRLTQQPLLALKFRQSQSQIDKDPYFSEEEKIKLQKQIVSLSVQEVGSYLKKEGLEKIDVLFNVYTPTDFGNQDLMASYHILNSSDLCNKLKGVKIVKTILLSSIYVKDPGFISEDQEMDSAIIPQQFHSKEELKHYLEDNFSSDIQRWQWSLEYIEKTFFHLTQQLVIVRVPSLGPTITNNQGYCPIPNNLTYLIAQIGLGHITHLHGLKINKVDIIPADYAAHLLIILAAKDLQGKTETINLSTTTRNYINLQQLIEIIREAWVEYGEKPTKVKIVETNFGQKLQQKREMLPSEVKRRLGTFLEIVSWKIEGEKRSVEQEQKHSLISKYKYFLCNEWLCESIKTIDIFNQLTSEEQQIFDFNVNHINWKIYVKLCVYSIKKYILHQDVEQFKPESLDLLGSLDKSSYFSDIMWALRLGRQTHGQTSKDAIQFVLNSRSVKDAVTSLAQANMLKLQNPPASYEKAEEELTKAAEEICTQMFSQYSMKSIRLFAWFLHKLFSTIYEKVVVDKKAIAMIQNHSESKGPLIILPTHRSYVDFLIISYVFFGYGIKCPHIAAAEDFLGMAFVHILLRKSGAFFIKRNQQKYKELYKAILNQYLSKLMIGNHFIEFFIEGTRSRTGKILPPKFGILSSVVQNVEEGRVPDAFIIPVTINYEKVLEGNSFTYEMMGQSKVKESLSRVLKSADVVKENYGRIHLQFCNMISVKKWLHTTTGTFPQKIDSLGNFVIRELTQHLVISGPAIVSTIVLMNRKGISDDSLQEQTTWLSKEISSRNIKITRCQPDSSISVNSTLALLDRIVNRSKKDMFEVEVSFDQNSFVKLFTLTYYRNTLTHIFFEEALIAASFASFGYNPLSKNGVSRDELFARCFFLWNLLKDEFYLFQSLANRERFEIVTEKMVNLSVFRMEGQRLFAVKMDSMYLNFYWSLIWPTVQSYWFTCLYLFKIIKNKSGIPLPKLLKQIQWFGQSLINDRISSYLQAISTDTIKNAVNRFNKMKIISQQKQEINGQETVSVKVNTNEEQLRKVLQEMELYLKNTYGNSLKGILESKHPSVNLDFPFLSRL